MSGTSRTSSRVPGPAGTATSTTAPRCGPQQRVGPHPTDGLGDLDLERRTPSAVRPAGRHPVATSDRHAHAVEQTPSPAAWPLSAPATALLDDPRTAPGVLLRLALRELVVRGAVRVQLDRRQRRRPAGVLLAPGDVDATDLPAPLSWLGARLVAHLDAAGTPATKALQRASGWRTDLGAGVREAARRELRSAGLLVAERTLVLGLVPRTRWRLTGSGRAWALSASGAVAGAAGVLPAAGLLLALDLELQRRLRQEAGALGDGGEWGDLEALDAVLGDAGPGLDSAADGASGGGGDGGDGGGGGD